MKYCIILILALFIFLLFLICYTYYSYYYYKNLEKLTLYISDTYKNIKNNTNVIGTPKIIIQTYHDKSKIPSKVYSNIRKYAPEYKHIIYDDIECINFLNKYYNKLVVNRFKSLENGAHKADLFRYCWLYKYGGVYLDIKINLIKPLNKIFKENILYTVSSRCKRTIFQGIISTPPNNPIFKVLINKLLNTPNIIVNIDYLIFTKHFYDEVKKCSDKNYKLFKEICNDKINKDLKYDRYRLKCAIYDKDERIFITRYSDYPW